MDEFKEYSQGFDAFEKIAAKFQEDPLQFKQQFTSNPKQEAITKVFDGKLGELWEECIKLEKQEGKSDEIIRCMDSIIEMNIKSLTTTDDDGRTSVAVEGDDIKFGATVEIEDDESGEKQQYQIVGEYESDIENKKLSITSPLARGLIGKTEEDNVEINRKLEGTPNTGVI